MRTRSDFIMAKDCNCDLENDWMLVEMDECGPIAVEEWDMVMENEITTNIAAEEPVQAIMKKEKIILERDMKTYYTCRSVTKEFLDNLLRMMMPRKPKAVLVILPSCQASEPAATHDFSSNNIGTTTDVLGSATENHQENSALQTGLDVIRRAKELLLKAGIRVETVTENRTRGVLAMPANVYGGTPMCQLSVQSKRDGAYHYNLGQVLSTLKKEGVLIVASGSSAENNNVLTDSEANCPPHKATLAFDNWIGYCLIGHRFEEIIRFERKSPAHARKIQPFNQRLYPLLTALGAAGEGAIAQRLDNGWAFCSDV